MNIICDHQINGIKFCYDLSTKAINDERFEGIVWKQIQLSPPNITFKGPYKFAALCPEMKTTKVSTMDVRQSRRMGYNYI